MSELFLLNGSMRCIFKNESLEAKGHLGIILQYVQKNSKNSSLKTSQDQLALHISNIDTIQKAQKELADIISIEDRMKEIKPHK